MKRLTSVPRGYTLLEVAVAMTITTALLIIGLPWVFSLISAAGDETSRGAFNRTVAAVEQTLVEDLGALITCGTTTGFKTLTATKTSWYAATSHGTELIEWELSPVLKRTTYPVADTGTCQPSPTPATANQWDDLSDVSVRDLNTVTTQTLFTPKSSNPTTTATVSLTLTSDDDQSRWVYKRVPLK